MSKEVIQSTKVLELGSCAFRQWRALPERHCGHIHGYQLKAKIWFGCSELDHRNWSVDFGGPEIKKLKKLLKATFDHKLVIAEDDPELSTFKGLDDRGACQLVIMPAVGIEQTAKFVLKLANEIVKESSDGRCWVNQVEVFEHDENSAIASYE